MDFLYKTGFFYFTSLGLGPYTASRLKIVSGHYGGVAKQKVFTHYLQPRDRECTAAKPRQPYESETQRESSVCPARRYEVTGTYRTPYPLL